MWEGWRGTDAEFTLSTWSAACRLAKRGAPFLASFAGSGDFDREKLQTQHCGSN